MKKIILLCCVLLLQLKSHAQFSEFAKGLYHSDNSQRVKVIPGTDKGWFEFSLDSLKIYKFNACGMLQWAEQFEFPGFPTLCMDIIPTKTGGFAFLATNYPSSNYHPLVVNADADGNVIWSNAYEDSLFTEIPYSLMQDKNGNFFIYGNVTILSNLDVYNSLTKIAANGTVLWSKMYDHGGIWGGAILTSDNGFLMRTGSIFMKTDANGNPNWTSSFNWNTHTFYKPVEVADGYIFNGYEPGFPGNDTIAFYKLNKNGTMAWAGKKKTSFKGRPIDLYSKYNGNFIFINPINTGNKVYSSWTEFDKDLIPVNQASTEKIGAFTNFFPSSICFLTDNSAVLGGRVTIKYPAVFPHIGFVKTNSTQHFGCDTSLSMSSYLKPDSLTFINTNTFTRQLQATPQFILTPFAQDSTWLLCSSLSPLKVELGADTNLCEGSEVTLKNNSLDSFDRFLWSNGATSQNITITSSGKYWLRAINSCRMDSVTDTIQVSFKNFPKPVNLKDTVICSSVPIILNASIPGATYVWHDGNTDSKYYVNEPGNYSVDISYLNCTKHFDTEVGDCEILLMPNVITPNNDASNNTFLPIEMQGINAAKLSVFNRWGQEIYQTSDIINRPWIGRTYTNVCPDGVYYYLIEYTNYLNIEKSLKGNVSLFSN